MKEKKKKEDKDKKEKKKKVTGKDKTKDLSTLKQKLEKINGKIQPLLEKKADIERQIKEVEAEGHVVNEENKNEVQ